MSLSETDIRKLFGKPIDREIFEIIMKRGGATSKEILEEYNKSFNDITIVSTAGPRRLDPSDFSVFLAYLETNKVIKFENGKWSITEQAKTIYTKYFG